MLNCVSYRWSSDNSCGNVRVLRISRGILLPQDTDCHVLDTCQASYWRLAARSHRWKASEVHRSDRSTHPGNRQNFVPRSFSTLFSPNFEFPIKSRGIQTWCGMSERWTHILIFLSCGMYTMIANSHHGPSRVPAFQNLKDMKWLFLHFFCFSDNRFGITRIIPQCSDGREGM